MKTRPQYLFRNTRGLVFVYVLLCVLTVLFTRSFFWETLHEGIVPSTLSLVVFFAAPVVLLLFLGVSLFNLMRDVAARRPGIRFRVRLLASFILIAVFAATPMTIVTSISISELVRFWRSFDANAARDASRLFAVENYSFHIGRFEAVIRETNWNAVLPPPEGGGAAGASAALPATLPSALPPGIASVQDFVLDGDGWRDFAFTGSDGGRLVLPPSQMPGFPARELPRDTGFIRYVMTPGANHIRLVSYGLGSAFDHGLAAIELQAQRFEVVEILQDNLRILEFFYYGVFFIPPLLMTMMIAFSITRRITSPIAELTEATRRVAGGDFSVQVLSTRRDELGLLVRSFNAMVQDLEKSRAALVKAEKISIWQSMAQQLAHEVKNPLTPIKLSAERVLRRWRNDPGDVGGIIEDSMLAIIQETEGLSTMINEFRTLSKPLEPSRSSIRFGEAAPEVINLYQSSYPNVVFDMAHAAENVVIKIDKTRFSQILSNLVINAVDAMDGSGTIEIRTDVVQKKGVDFCRISLKDSGKGMPNDKADQVFAPYFTTKESGTGLGLPIVEKIVNDHGGSIWFNSSEGIGTVFFVDLPLGEAG
ncbi:MAG: ATP-binding protein [Treponema sp.]|nr:ATP-binding protein [Treponema sp.]